MEQLDRIEAKVDSLVASALPRIASIETELKYTSGAIKLVVITLISVAGFLATQYFKLLGH